MTLLANLHSTILDLLHSPGQLLVKFLQLCFYLPFIIEQLSSTTPHFSNDSANIRFEATGVRLWDFLWPKIAFAFLQAACELVPCWQYDFVSFLRRHSSFFRAHSWHKGNSEWLFHPDLPRSLDTKSSTFGKRCHSRWQASLNVWKITHNLPSDLPQVASEFSISQYVGSIRCHIL